MPSLRVFKYLSPFLLYVGAIVSFVVQGFDVLLLLMELFIRLPPLF